MLTNKRNKFVLIAIVICSMIATYGYGPRVKAASMDSVSVTLSDSNGGAAATSTIAFLMDATADNSYYLTENEWVKVYFDPTSGAFGDPGSAANFTCPSQTTASSTAGVDFVECVVDAGDFLESTTTWNIIIGNIDNPAGEDTAYNVNITTHQSDGTEILDTRTKVYIIDNVSVSATVDATLTFSVGALDPNTSATTTVNGIALTGTSTSNTMPFGDLSITSSSTLGHLLSVTTNATQGFSVTVQQDGELTSAAGDNINSFNNSNDGTGTTTPEVWDAPRAEFGETFTYGHMGVTSGDNIASFEDGKYAGLNGIDPLTVMSHNNPSDGTAWYAGRAPVGYTIEISSYQEAGDYTSTLTYVCTPTY